MNYKPLTISPVLDTQTLERMYQAALDMLARTGLRVDHPEIGAEIAARKGFALVEDRVRVSPERVREWQEGYRKRHAAHRWRPSTEGPLDLIYATSDRSKLIAEPDGRTVRAMTTEDVIAGTKLIHMLAGRGVHGCTAGVPCDVPVALQPLEQFMIGAQYCGAGGATSWVTNIATAEIIRDMNKVYGRAFGQSVWCPSPLVLGGPELGMLWHFRREVVYAGVGTMPAMGISGPCDPVALFTLSVAESIGGATILEELLPGVPVDIGPHPEPAEMRGGAMIFGSPEFHLLDLMHKEVYEYLGSDYSVKHILTSVSVPNLQCQVERATSAILGVLGRYRGFEPVGQLGIDVVWSPEQLLLDLDIIADAKRIGDGAYSAPGLELERLGEVVEEVVASGSAFVGHETTARNFREQYTHPRVLQRLVPSQWEAAGKPEVLAEAQRQAEELIAAYEYEPPQDILRELRVIHEKARERLASVPP